MSHDPVVNDFARRAFRDIADQDYIAARMSYKANIWEPFLWSSQQAFEKILKAILIFNDQSAKGLRHDLKRAYKRIVTEIPEIGFSVPDDVMQFIHFIGVIGTNRYFEYPTTISRDALVLLDKSYWFIRRFCFNINSTIRNENGETIHLLNANLRQINNET
jgi:HEPN domain-containing protein